MRLFDIGGLGLRDRRAAMQEHGPPSAAESARRADSTPEDGSAGMGLMEIVLFSKTNPTEKCGCV